ncbi:MAG: SAVED domain-containing protein [Candidatus Sumerlaeaceae bacterium]
MLTDSKGMGGIVAQEGFDYQVWYGLIRIPAWIRDDSFEGVTFEGFEDIEARFLAAHTPSGHFLDRFQAKSGELNQRDVHNIFADFLNFEKYYPEVARTQRLVTLALPTLMKWLLRDPQRVDNARPFYEPFPHILPDSIAKVRNDCIKEFGKQLGDFVARSVAIEIFTVCSRDIAATHFQTKLIEIFPHLNPITVRQTFDALYNLAAQNRGKMLSRALLIQTIEQAQGETLRLPNALGLHLRSDRNAPKSNSVEIDARAFSGEDLTSRKTNEWQFQLLEPLLKVSRWTALQGYRRVKITGQFRLSTGFAAGWAFRANSGFELEIPAKDDIWCTDSHSPVGSKMQYLDITEPRVLEDSRLVVSVGIIKEPTIDVQQFLGYPDNSGILVLHYTEPVTNATEAQLLVRQLKESISKTAASLGAKTIDLFYVGPVALAVAIGHRWNGMPPTQFYEYDSKSRRYVPSVHC